jgi:hypothetical protein
MSRSAWDRRLPEQVEPAADYAGAEALTNAATHAQATAGDVGGWLSLQSPRGAGTTVVIVLPLAEPGH